MRLWNSNRDVKGNRGLFFSVWPQVLALRNILVKAGCLENFQWLSPVPQVIYLVAGFEKNVVDEALEMFGESKNSFAPLPSHRNFYLQALVWNGL